MSSQKKPSAIKKGEALLQAQKKSFSKSVRAIDFAASVHANRIASNNNNNNNNNHGSTIAHHHHQQQPMNKAIPLNLQTISKVPVVTLSGQLYQIIDFLKRQETPQTISQIRQALRIDLEKDVELLERVSKNPKIKFVDGQFAYKPTHDIQSKDDLRGLLRTHYESGVGGIHVRDLKDTWKGITKAIEELEQEKKIFVIRHKDKPVVLFYNEMPINFTVKPEFKQLWEKVRVPDDEDVQRELSVAGLKLLEVKTDTQTQANDGEEKKKKARKQRRIKMTNTHLKNIDLSVDYPIKK